MKKLKEITIGFSLIYLHLDEELFYLKILNIDTGNIDTSFLEIYRHENRLFYDILYFWAIYNIFFNWIDKLKDKGILTWK